MESRTSSSYDFFSEKPDFTDLSDLTDELERQELPAWAEAKTTKRRSTSYLDGLRGLAALMVYMSHHIPWFYGFDTAENSLERGYGDGARDFAMLPFIRIFFTGGSAAVSIFFVLSGYVLSRNPMDMLRRGQVSECQKSLVSATIRRPFRLLLPAAAVSLAFALVMQLPFGMAPYMTWPEAKANLAAQLLNWADEFWRIADPFRRHGIAERWFPYNPPLWTISIEFRGSLIVFALIAWYSRFGPWVRLVLFTTIGLAFLFLYQWSMACFMAGVVFAIIDEEGMGKSSSRRLSPSMRNIINTMILMLGWWFLCQPAGKREPERAMKAPGWYYMTQWTPGVYLRQEYWRFWHSWGAALLVYGLLRVEPIQRLFNTKYLRYLGKVSFALYLTHIPFLWTIGDRIYRTFGRATMDFKTEFDDWLRVPDIGPRGLSTRFIISQVFILTLNLLLAHAVTIWIDEPSIRFARWVSNKSSPRLTRSLQNSPSLR